MVAKHGDDCGGSGLSVRTLREARAEFDRYYLMQALDVTNGSIKDALMLLGLSRGGLYKLFARLNIPVKRWRYQRITRITSPVIQAFLYARSPAGPARYLMKPRPSPVASGSKPTKSSIGVQSHG